jgi:hypothetical protein
MRTLLAAVTFVTLAGTVAGQSLETPATYANARFGYTIAYPANLFRAEPEAENGDGRKFRARHGAANFSVWAGYNALEQTPAEIAAEAGAACLHQPPVYRIVKAMLVAVSCETADGIFYRKTLIRGDVLTSFEMTYPASERARWDSVLAKISGSLTAAQ